MHDTFSGHGISGNTTEGNWQLVEIHGIGVFGEEKTQKFKNFLITYESRGITNTVLPKA
jgi:hypothetical protein